MWVAAVTSFLSLKNTQYGPRIAHAKYYAENLAAFLGTSVLIRKNEGSKLDQMTQVNLDRCVRMLGRTIILRLNRPVLRGTSRLCSYRGARHLDQGVVKVHSRCFGLCAELAIITCQFASRNHSYLCSACTSSAPRPWASCGLLPAGSGTERVLAERALISVYACGPRTRRSKLWILFLVFRWSYPVRLNSPELETQAASFHSKAKCISKTFSAPSRKFPVYLILAGCKMLQPWKAFLLQVSDLRHPTRAEGTPLPLDAPAGKRHPTSARGTSTGFKSLCRRPYRVMCCNGTKTNKVCARRRLRL